MPFLDNPTVVKRVNISDKIVAPYGTICMDEKGLKYPCSGEEISLTPVYELHNGDAIPRVCFGDGIHPNNIDGLSVEYKDNSLMFMINLNFI